MKQGNYRAILAVLAAMFGVRSSQEFEKDHKVSIIHFIVAGFAMTLFFILSLILIIKYFVLG